MNFRQKKNIMIITTVYTLSYKMNCDNNKGFKFPLTIHHARIVLCYKYIEKQNKTPTVYRIYKE